MFLTSQLVLFLDDFDKKENIDRRIRAKFKRSGHNYISIFIISQDYNELPEKTI